jgi:hypothetical protein
MHADEVSDCWSCCVCRLLIADASLLLLLLRVVVMCFTTVRMAQRWVDGKVGRYVVWLPASMWSV